MSIDTLADHRYEIGDLLGSGGMGLVYRAHDTRLGRDVAVKLLADNLAQDAEARERFSREARAAARLSHPNVVQVFDVGEEDGRPYLVMELIDGPSLAEVLGEQGSLPADEVYAVAGQALAALDAAHEADLLHRDLKPGNLMRAADGTVKVTDFGVAEVGEAPGLTRSGVVLGTLPYLAPERLSGAPATTRTDLYGLGATLLQLLTGEAPPASKAAPPDTSTFAAGGLDTVPPQLALLLQRCLAPDPTNRPRSAAEALGILNGQTVTRDVAGRTRVLPAMDVPTAVQRPGPADADAPTEAFGAPSVTSGTPGDGQHRRGRRRWRAGAVMVGLALVATLAVVLALRLGSGGSHAATDTAPSNETATTPADSGSAPGGGGDAGGDHGGGGGVPPAGDPTQQMRQLGDWLRQQAG